LNSKPTLRDFGPVDAPLYLLARLLRRLLPGHARLVKYVYWAQPVPAEPLMSTRRAAVTIRLLRPGDAELSQIPRDARRIDLRFANGDLCLGAVRGERLAGYMWLSTGPYEEDEVRARFEPAPEGRAAWDYDIFLLPEERGGLTFARLWDAAYGLLRERGYGWCISRISAFNLASSASQARMGARRLGWGIFIVLFRYQLMLSSITPFLHLSLRGGHRPVLRLDAECERLGRAPR
jgi:hypothetical protein